MPVTLTTLGRTGSTLLVSLLAAHHEVVAYPPYEAEPRLLTYWLDVVRTLGHPTSYLHALLPDGLGDPYWWLDRPAHTIPYVPIGAVLGSLTEDHVTATVELARRSVDRFYRTAAAMTEKESASTFVEKFLPQPDFGRALQEVFPRTRNVILTRDFRDMATSIFAMDAKRGYYGFGRLPAQTDEAYIDDLAAAADLLAQTAVEQGAMALVVRYEDVLVDPPAAVTQLLEYLELDCSRKLVNEIISKAIKPSDELEFHRTTVDTGASVGRWRTDLPPPVRAKAEEAFGSSLQTFGYS